MAKMSETKYGKAIEKRASLVAHTVKNLLAMQEMQVRSLSWEDPLKKGKTTHSSILPYSILYSPWDRRESDMTEWLSLQSVQFSSVAQSCPTLCDPMNRSTTGLPLHHLLSVAYKLNFRQTWAWVSVLVFSWASCFVSLILGFVIFNDNDSSSLIEKNHWEE